MSELFNDLCAYDGKAVTLLSEAQVIHGSRSTYLSELVALSASEHAHVSEGATWLLKESAQEGEALTPDEVRALIRNVEMITNWPAQLHVCQMVGFITVPTDSAASLANWLIGLLEHTRPFLRAWSMSALSALAAQHPAYAARAQAALQAARDDASASVRARARNVDNQAQRDRRP